MTNEELLKERYKVIADYPGCKFKVGDILTYVREIAQTYDLWRNEATGVEITYSGFRAYPHLFEPLPWWKDRKVEDMPQYVKHIATGRIWIVKAYDLPAGAHLIGVEISSYWAVMKNLEPATKEEYEAYLQTTNQLNNGQ